MMSLMFKTWHNVLVLGVLLLIFSVVLYFSWYRYLPVSALSEKSPPE